MDAKIDDIVVPLIERLHLFTYKEHSASEYHFAIMLLRKKIIYAIEVLNPPKMVDKSALLFLPKGEHYDLLLLYVQYKLKRAGLQIH